MSNQVLKSVPTPLVPSDFVYEPMNPNFRSQKCRSVGCINGATQVRWRYSIDGPRDKSSKTFLCESHLLENNF